MIYHQIRIALKPDAPNDQVGYALELPRRTRSAISGWPAKRSVRTCAILPSIADAQLVLGQLRLDHIAD